MPEMIVPRGPDVRPILMAMLHVNGPVTIGHADLGDAAIADLRGELELVAVEVDGGYRYEARPPAAPAEPPAELTGAQQQVARILADPNSIIDWDLVQNRIGDTPGIDYSTAVRLISTAQITVSWPQGADAPAQAAEQGPLIDPDCAGGKCASCVGGPCEHHCHTAQAGDA